MNTNIHWEDEIKSQRKKGWYIILGLLVINVCIALIPTLVDTVDDWQWKQHLAEAQAEKDSEKAEWQERIDKIEKALDMEDFDEVNAKIEEFIKLKGEWNEYLNGKKGDYDIREDVAYQFYKNGEDFILYERVWKKEARYLIKKGDRSGFTELISIISLYNISTPKVEEKFNMSYAKKYESDSYYWREHRGDYEILESGRKYKKEVDTFNDVVDDIVNQAILMKNKELAECALELYRKGVTLTDNSIWKYNDDALNAAKKRIQEAK